MKKYKALPRKLVPNFKDENGKWAWIGTVTGSHSYITTFGQFYSSMKLRCVPNGYIWKRHPTYVGCTNDFGGFQDFCNWAVHQVGYDIPGYHLDKDILAEGTKSYSPDTCVFVPQHINKLFKANPNPKRDLPLGVHIDERGRIIAQLSKTGRKTVVLGRFKTVDAAFLAFKHSKEKYVKELAEQYKSTIDTRVYAKLIAYEVQPFT